MKKIKKINCKNKIKQNTHFMIQQSKNVTLCTRNVTLDLHVLSKLALDYSKCSTYLYWQLCSNVIGTKLINNETPHQHLSHV